MKPFITRCCQVRAAFFCYPEALCLMKNCTMMWNVLLIHFTVLTGVSTSSHVDEINEDPVDNITIGSCSWLLDRKCPDDEVKFWLFTRTNVNDKQLIHVDDTMEHSNLSSSFFNPRHPSKIIIHGYRSDFYLTPLHEMKHGKTYDLQQYLSWTFFLLPFTQNIFSKTTSTYFMLIGEYLLWPLEEFLKNLFNYY